MQDDDSIWITTANNERYHCVLPKQSSQDVSYFNLFFFFFFFFVYFIILIWYLVARRWEGQNWVRIESISTVKTTFYQGIMLLSIGTVLDI